MFRTSSRARRHAARAAHRTHEFQPCEHSGRDRFRAIRSRMISEQERYWGSARYARWGGPRSRRGGSSIIAGRLSRSGHKPVSRFAAQQRRGLPSTPPRATGPATPQSHKLAIGRSRPARSRAPRRPATAAGRERVANLGCANLSSVARRLDERMASRTWEGGVASSHAELEAADKEFWSRAGASARVTASLLLALEVDALSNPDGSSPRIDRTVFGVRRRGHALHAGGRTRRGSTRASALDQRR